MFPRNIHDPAILGGKPCIKGTRLSVEFLLELIATGGTPETIAQKYPEITAKDVQEAVRYAAHFLKNDVGGRTRIAG